MRRPTTLFLCATGVLFALLYAVEHVHALPLQTALYGISYALPIAGALYIRKTVDSPILASPARPQGLWHTVLCFPAVFGLLLTVAVVGSTVFSTPTVSPTQSTAAFFSLLRHALLCPLAEEFFFRLLPMRLYPKSMVKEAFLISLLSFAVFHASAARLLHAALAAAVFFLADLAADSVWPSVLLHVGNNALALVYARFSSSEAFCIFFYIIVAITGAFSLIYAFLQRKRFISILKSKFISTT